MPGKTLEATILLNAKNLTGKAFAGAKADANSLRQTMLNVGRDVRRVGYAMSAAVTLPIVALAKASFDAFAERQSALAQLDAVLKSMGPVAHFDAEQLKGMAEGLEAVTTFGRTDILKGVTVPLLAFGHIHGKVFQEAQKAALDYATRTKTELPEAAQKIGMALNYPDKAGRMLRGMGIILDAVTQQQIKNLLASGRAGAGRMAQLIILRELEKKYQGAAAAEAQTAAGQIAQMKNSWAAVKEELGGIIAGPLLPIFKSIRGALESFKALPGPVKTTLVIIAAGAAVAGPALVLLGTAISGLTIAFGALTGAALPWIAGAAAIAGAGYLIYKNWAPIKEFFVGIWDYAAKAVGAVWKVLKPVVDALKWIADHTGLTHVAQVAGHAAVAGARVAAHVAVAAAHGVATVAGAVMEHGADVLAGRTPRSFADLLAGGEAIRGSYGTANWFTNGKLHGGIKDLTHESIAQVMAQQSARSIFAAGRYQIIPATMRQVVAGMHLSGSEMFDEKMQDRMLGYLIQTKRPAIAAYISGRSSNLRAAMNAAALEWASVGDLSRGGASHYGGPNKASITPESLAQALIRERNEYRGGVGKGELRVTIATDGGARVTGIRSRAPERLAVTTGVDNTGHLLRPFG